MKNGFQGWMRSKALAISATTILLCPILAGCGSASDSRSAANMPPVDDSYNQRAQTFPQSQPQTHGMSTGTKLAMLAGAAALYYMYKKNKEKRAQGDTSAPQYYLSKNGRVYYRDNTGRAHWVSPPPQGIQVPLSEAQQYEQFQGYNGRTSGRTLEDYAGAYGGN